MRTATALVFALVLGSCGGVAPSNSHKAGGLPDPVPMLVGEHWLGFAACVSRPTAWVRADVLGTPEGPQVVAHELAHLELARSFPSCSAFALWMHMPGNRALFEAHGHCAGATVDRITGRAQTWDGAIRMHGARLAHAYPFGLSEPAAEALIRRFCEHDPREAA